MRTVYIENAMPKSFRETQKNKWKNGQENEMMA